MVKKRQKPNRSKLFEYLPNEIFVEIFSYLNGIDALVAFSQLNSRFQCLVFEYCQFFDFTSISKTQFDLVVQYYNTKQWRSLKISDDKHTPDHVEYFCQFYSLINDCPQLQSLAILNMNEKKCYTILSQLPLLTNLVSLKLESICGEKMSQFVLSNLKRLVFTSCPNLNWIKNFPQVISIKYTFAGCYAHEQDIIWPIALKHLKIVFTQDRDIDLIQRSLVYLSSLISLELYQKHATYSVPNGQPWENLIRSSLPLLKTFKFYFQFQPYLSTTINVKEIIASFSTPFYIDEKKWFVRYDRSPTYGYHLALFSIPFPFEEFITSNFSFNESISTSPEYENTEFYTNKYAHVKTLCINNMTAEPNENFDGTTIINLIVNVNFDFGKWRHIFTKLRHLDLTSNVAISSKNFHLLLETTPYLCSLSIKKSLLRTLTEDWNHVFICKYLSENIRVLKLHHTYQQSYRLSQNELHHIIRIFSSKCQHLSLAVHTPNDALEFILNMSQLHSLHVNINTKHYEPLNIMWLEKQQTKFNNSNCMMINEGTDYYFWL